MTEGLLKVCRNCGRYTLKEKCSSCQGPTNRPDPARFSPQDRYGKYRRALLDAERSRGGP